EPAPVAHSAIDVSSTPTIDVSSTPTGAATGLTIGWGDREPEAREAGSGSGLGKSTRVESPRGDR
ncbi:MAG: hypothetical protein V5A46_08820, partial [Haloferacaceae archaeon]